MDQSILGALAQNKIQNAPDALKSFMKTHWHFFEAKAFEAQDDEQYRYTNIAKYFEGFNLKSTSDLHSPEVINGFETLTFLDGKIQGELKVAGIKIHSLKDNFEQVGALIDSNNALTHLHHSLLENGVVIEIEKNAEITKPLRIINLQSTGSLVSSTAVIKAERFSKVSIIEENLHEANSYARLAETYIQVAEGAQVELIQVDQGGTEALHHAHSTAEVAKDGIFRNVVLHLSGKINRRNVEMKIKDPGAHGESFNLYLTNDTEHSDLNTVIHHLAEDTTSAQIAKGILDGESKGIFTGKIHIHPQAQRVNSSQLNKNLLLSKKAQVHSQPQLEIFADDVKCSHGSTTGQLSDDEVFYFEARGIPQDKARTLLAHGFGLEVVLKIQNEVIRKHVEKLVMETLKTKFKLGGEK